MPLDAQGRDFLFPFKINKWEVFPVEHRGNVLLKHLTVSSLWMFSLKRAVKLPDVPPAATSVVFGRTCQLMCVFMKNVPSHTEAGRWSRHRLSLSWVKEHESCRHVPVTTLPFLPLCGVSFVLLSGYSDCSLRCWAVPYRTRGMNAFHQCGRGALNCSIKNTAQSSSV